MEFNKRKWMLPVVLRILVQVLPANNDPIGGSSFSEFRHSLPGNVLFQLGRTHFGDVDELGELMERKD